MNIPPPEPYIPEPSKLPIFGDDELRNLIGSLALIKACSDTFDYALQLRNGTVIRFEHAELVALDWVRLTLWPGKDLNPTLPYPSSRGIEVRLSEIVWVMDCPMGT